MYIWMYLGLYLYTLLFVIIIVIYRYFCIFLGLTVVHVFGLTVVLVAGILAKFLGQTIFWGCIVCETTLHAIQ